jgi:hypothetical protein
MMVINTGFQKHTHLPKTGMLFFFENLVSDFCPENF